MISRKTKKVEVNFWFMTDSHGFYKINGDNLREIALDFIQVAKENPHGMVCEPFVDGVRVGKCVHVDKHGHFDIKEYFEELLKNETIRKIFDYGK